MRTDLALLRGCIDIHIHSAPDLYNRIADHFETARDPWDLLRTIVRERKTREFDPTVAVLRDCVSDPAFAAEDAATRSRLAETLALMEALSSWSEDMLRLDTQRHSPSRRRIRNSSSLTSPS